ncbi:MAG TPA: hypothetical protein VK050_06420 [Flavobacteriaceae bacterium]|nr:hypothetical protein [Flavobacteriaceae bacterium]
MRIDFFQMTDHLFSLKDYSIEEIKELRVEYNNKYRSLNNRMRDLEVISANDVIHRQELLKLSKRVYKFIKELNLELGRRLVK